MSKHSERTSHNSDHCAAQCFCRGLIEAFQFQVPQKDDQISLSSEQSSAFSISQVQVTGASHVSLRDD